MNMRSLTSKEVLQSVLFLLLIPQYIAYNLQLCSKTRTSPPYSFCLHKHNPYQQTILYSSVQDATADSNASVANNLQEDLSIGNLPVGSPILNEPEAPPAALSEEQISSPVLEEEEEPEIEAPYYYARDFVNTTWVVAALWKKDGPMDVTKVYLRDDGTCVWLNGAEGTWRLNTRRRAISIYRDFTFGWGGKRIFSTALDQDYNNVYLNGTIKGWAPWSPAKVWGMWQAVREGTDFEKWGMPPWYEESPKDGTVTAPLKDPWA